MFSQKPGQVFGRFCRILGIVLLLLAASCLTTMRATEWRIDFVDVGSGGMFSSNEI